MSNRREISPTISVFTPTGMKVAKYLQINEFFDYRFNDGGGTVSFRMIEEVDNGTTTLQDGTIVSNPITYNELYGATMQIPSNIVQTWGTSDQVIFDYVAQTLGITII